ncbi:hypothetical protein EPN42_03630 [bacterium]|nr:MAG: hypothetical protein EPN42_03630 [bacterium]
MNLLKLTLGIVVALGVVAVVATIVGVVYRSSEGSARIAACEGTAQLVAAELQAVQIGNPAVSVPVPLSTSVPVATVPAGVVTLKERGKSLTTTTAVGGVPCLSDRIAIAPLSLSDNAQIARPTPTP